MTVAERCLQDNLYLYSQCRVYTEDTKEPSKSNNPAPNEAEVLQETIRVIIALDISLKMYTHTRAHVVREVLNKATLK